MRRKLQRGASALLILLIMVLLLVAFFAAYTVSRITASGDESTDTQKRLAAAASALERFAAANSRLPCPTDPSTTAGTEATASAATCSFNTGTLPWLTLGLTSDAGLDGWGRKISYRVYTGNKGSFTQPGGVSMVDCDTNEPTIGSVTNVSASVGGLCVTGATAFDHSSSTAKFLSGKGLTVYDLGVTHNDVAYVVISHGASGLGAWTIAGAQLDAPNSADEKNNLKDTGPFTVKAFSGADIEAIHATHFDDLLAYATIADLAKRAGLEARDWADTATSSLTFDAPTVAAALGTSSVTPGDLGTTRLDFGSATVTGYTGGSTTESNLSYDTNASQGGLGVAGGINEKISSLNGELLRIKLTEPGAKFSITLNDFGTYSIFSVTFTEQFQLKFYLDDNLVYTSPTMQACRADGGLASFAVTPSSPFNTIDVVPVNATAGSFSWDTSFLVSEIKACTSGTVNCKTSLTTGANTCP